MNNLLEIKLKGCIDLPCETLSLDAARDPELVEGWRDLEKVTLWLEQKHFHHRVHRVAQG